MNHPSARFAAALLVTVGLFGAGQARADYTDWHPIDVEAKVHAVHAMTADPIEGLMRENPPESWDLRAAIATYHKPLLLAMAAPGESINDDDVLAEIGRDHSAMVEMATFPGAGHNLHRTAFDDFARVLDVWLGRV